MSLRCVSASTAPVSTLQTKVDAQMWQVIYFLDFFPLTDWFWDLQMSVTMSNSLFLSVETCRLLTGPLLTLYPVPQINPYYQNQYFSHFTLGFWQTTRLEKTDLRC